MVTKMQAKGAEVDWKRVDQATEVKRTYLVRDRLGREFFKMYKPSEARAYFKATGCTGQIVSTLNRSAG